VTFLQPSSLAEALTERAQHPDALVVAGGTDVLVEVNFERAHPETVLDITRVPELVGWRRDSGRLRLGAAVTYRELIHDLACELPALAMAARTVGSPPIRNRGTIGGNLGSASPAGDCHPPLLASGAEVELASAGGIRTVPIAEFFVGPKRSVLGRDELITAVLVPAASGPEVFTKVGTRNAMVIAVCSLALALHPGTDEGGTGRVGTGIGSAGPVPLRAAEAEEYLAEAVAEINGWESKSPLDPAVIERFADLVAGAARPIDDVRGSATYRRHALRVLARRALRWCWTDYCDGQRGSGAGLEAS
jgi:CO/xanthine dehydrogenase FAD-binding subunit